MKYFVFDHHDFWQWPLSTVDSVEDADIIFLWADWPFESHVRQLKSMGKKVIVYEHGFGALWDYELNHRKPIADGYLALGKESKESLVRTGVKEENILITGNPVFDDVVATEHKGNKAIYVALHWVRDMSEYNIDMFNKLVQSYSELDWSIKLIDKTGDIQTDRKKWFNVVEGGNILQDIKDKLPGYDYIFTPKSSTFEAFGRLMGIPVYVVDKEETYKIEGEPNRVPLNETFISIGDKLPECSIIDMSNYIERPSLSIDDILNWVKDKR